MVFHLNRQKKKEKCHCWNVGPSRNISWYIDKMNLSDSYANVIVIFSTEYLSNICAMISGRFQYTVSYSVFRWNWCVLNVHRTDSQYIGRCFVIVSLTGHRPLLFVQLANIPNTAYFSWIEIPTFCSSHDIWGIAYTLRFFLMTVPLAVQYFFDL